MNHKPNVELTYLSAEGLKQGTAAYTHVMAVADELKALGYSVTVLADMSASYTSATIFARLTRYIRLSFTALISRRTCKLFYLRSHFALAPIALLLKLTGAKIITEVNGLAGDMTTTYRFLRPFTGLISTSEKMLFKASASVVTVTPELKTRVEATADKGKIFAIPNGVHTNRFAHQAPAHPPYAIFFGSLAAWHGVPTLLKAVRHSEWPNDLILKIAGDGQFKDKIEAEAKTNPLCVYLGPVAPSDMPDLIAQASLGLSPIELPEQRGLKEVCPLKLLEMLAAGLPVVVSDVAGQKELVLENKVGLTFPEADAAALAKTVAQLWRDEAGKKRMRKNTTKAIASYDWKRIVGEINDKAIRPHVP